MPPHIEVELTFLPTEHGGRIHPVASGYRPQFYYRGEDCDAVHTYPDAPEVRPGQTVIARLAFLRPEYHLARITVGMPFLIREGNRVVGYGRVSRFLDPAADQSVGFEPIAMKGVRP